jgi:2-polyprenyl-3-methyl-5-hydroxy-6-metoxy-1,4-benzoquinol methylase
MSATGGICVIGMGRSGTSLVANLIAELGVTVGPRTDLLGPSPKGENPRGYWEQRAIRELNDEILGHLGGGWYDVVDPAPGWELDTDLDELYARAKDILAELFAGASAWAFKDPRVSITFPFWQRLIGPFRSVICVRDPAEVASSLERRDAAAHPRWRSSAVWLAYTSWALEHTRDQPRLIVRYEDLMEDPETEVRRLGWFIDPDGQQVAGAAAAETVDRALWHHKQSRPEDNPDPALLPEAIALHALLRSSAKEDEIDEKAVELRRLGLARVGPVSGGALPQLTPGGEGESERFDPDSMSGVIAAEHVLRYLAAAQLASGRRVLDAGCGHGYGTAILADGGASSAVGVDISEEAVREATSSHASARFEVGDVSSLPFDEDSFDLVTCFEAVEHLVRRDEALNDLARVLAPDGVLVISTPNRLRYRKGNPHHVYEYEPEEFRLALAERFDNVRLLRQHTLTASLLLPDDAPDEILATPQGLSETTDRGGELYTLALASNGPLPELDSMATLVSPDDPASPEHVLAEAQTRNAALKSQNAEIARRNRRLQEVNSAMSEKNQELRAKLEERARND